MQQTYTAPGRVVPSQTTVRAAVLGLGIYVPPRLLDNHELATRVDTSDEWIVERTGIRTRHIAAPDQAASDLAVPACLDALRDADLGPADLDLILCATTTPDMLFPATACLIQERIGARRAGACDVLAACSSFLCAMITAAQMIEAGLVRYALVVGAEVLSKLVDWTDRTLCVLVGDGAGAVVMGPSTSGAGVLASVAHADGGAGDMLKLPAGGSRMPITEEVLAQRLHYPRMDGRTLFKLAVRVVPEVIEEVTRKAGLTLDEVTWIVPHQANQRILEAVARAMHLPIERFICTIDRYGNTSAASVPICLAEAADAGALRPGMNLVLVAFGAGLSWAASVVRWGWNGVPGRE
jgi:3-oxoacyl-[acyl-carrier-protein] synthase-3